MLSANTQESLKKYVSNTKEYADAHPERISDLSYTLSQRREHLAHRAFFLAGTTSTLEAVPLARIPANAAGITMIFSGQGAQWPQMACELISTDVEFQKDIIAMDGLLSTVKYPPTWSLRSKDSSFLPTPVTLETVLG